MCVWRRGVDAAVAKLPLSGRNVYLLPALVQPFLSPTAEARDNKSDAGLGRVLFERRANWTTVLAAAIAGIAMTAIGGGMLSSYLLQQNGNEGLVVGGIILVIAGLLDGVVAFWLAFTAFRCHERGVWQRTLLGQKTLRYADVGGFQFSAVRDYHHGAYTGTQLTMRFRPLAADRGRAIRYLTRIKGDDDDLESLRDSVSRIIAGAMAEQLSRPDGGELDGEFGIEPQAFVTGPAVCLDARSRSFCP